MKNRTRASRANRGRCVAIVLWSTGLVALAALIYLFLTFFSFVEHLRAPRFCLDMNRHRVRPELPPVPGAQEPFAVGYLGVDLPQRELTWEIADGLGFEPHTLAVHGPIRGPDLSTAPVFVQLTLDRDAGHKFHAVLDVSRERLQQILARPSLFYVAITHKDKNGHEREIVRDPLGRLCSTTAV